MPPRDTLRDQKAFSGLVFRFAAVTAMGLALAAALILLIVRHFDTMRAERHAIDRARFVTDAFVRESLRPGDVGKVVKGERRKTLDTLFERHVLLDGTVRVAIVSKGRITYSSDHREIGDAPGDAGLYAEAESGRVVSTVKDLPEATVPKVLRTYVPVVVGRKARVPGVVVYDQDYSLVAGEIEESFLPIVGVFEVVLGGLFVLLLPALSRASARLRRQAEELRRRADFDPLTGLHSRSGFGELTDRLLRTGGGRAVVVVLNLDRFKVVNQGLGRESGDQVLRQVAGGLGRLRSGGRIVSRLGGDMFAIAMRVGDDASAAEIGESARQLVAKPFSVFGVPMQVSATAGLAFAPDHGKSAEELLQRAEVAVDIARAEHAPVAVYDPMRNTNDASRIRLMAELRAAIDRRELHLVFQPIVSLSSGEVERVEALVRWDHPRLGPLPPANFVPLAEHTELIAPLTRLVLQDALAACARWYEAGADVAVSVNVSSIDLLDESLPAAVERALAQHDLPARVLVLELTESTAMIDSERVRNVLDALCKLGVGIAIDDFGTGYSSLARLQRLPVQAIKIDRSFVGLMLEDENADTIVRSTVELGKSLGLAVVAEGIEEAAHWERLVALGCDFGQGYLIGREVTAQAIVDAMAGPRAGGAYESRLAA
jgi:diguanylate cyclase (GGDEF)-like protein